MLYILSAIAGAALFAAGLYAGRLTRPKAGAAKAPPAAPEPSLAILAEDGAEERLLKMNKQWANMMAYNGEAGDAG